MINSNQDDNDIFSNDFSVALDPRFGETAPLLYEFEKKAYDIMEQIMSEESTDVLEINRASKASR